jgi:hypothetical protein
MILLTLAWAEIGSAEIKTYRLEPKEFEEFPMAKLSGVEGTVGREAHRYLIDKLTILQPVAVAVRTLEPRNAIELTVHKYSWDESERSLTTNENGVAIAHFRTQGEFQFQLRSTDDPAPYQLVVMVGDEVPPIMPRVVLSETEFQEWESSSAGASAAINWWTVVIVLLLAGILLFLFKIYRRLGRGENHV